MILEITRKKLFLIGSFIVVMLAIPLTVYLSQRQQDTQSRASEVPDTTVVAIFNNGEQITKGQVRQVAEEQNDPSVVDAQALKDGLQTLIERKILDLTADDLGIEPDPDQISNLVADGFSEEDARYEVLRDQIIIAKVKSREALSVEFWNPPANALEFLTAVEKENARQELADGIPALVSAETKMNAGTEVIDVGGSLLTTYPSLKPVLAVNGYILSSLNGTEKEFAAFPQTYQFGDSSLDQATLNALFAMNINEIKKITNTQSNRGGTVFKLVSKGNDSGAVTYDDWLEEQTSDLVDDLGIL